MNTKIKKLERNIFNIEREMWRLRFNLVINELKRNFNEGFELIYTSDSESVASNTPLLRPKCIKI